MTPSEDKILTVAQLAERLEQLRAADQAPRVVHCHGVFDLLHVGHLRYFQQARKLGDLLVVTVTPDRYVNKGPHRPAFAAELRAEVIAAVECVDFVAINEWPTATETLQSLRPDIYAKGAEYRDKRTPEIEAEEQVVHSVGAEMAYIEDVTSSSSRLLNKYLSPFSEAVNQYLGRLAADYPLSRILSYLEGAARLKVLVVGEAIIDEYHYGRMMGRSSSAPIVGMHYLSQERFAGGTAAVANHIAALAGEVTLVTIAGDQDNEAEWLQSQLKPNVTARFITKSGSPTIVKRRYRESYFALPMFEIYYMNGDPMNDADDATLRRVLAEEVARHDVVVVVDYGHGMIQPSTARLLFDRSRFLAVNTQANAGNYGYNTLSKYPRADFICLAEQELRLDCRNQSGDLRPMLREVCDRLGADRAMVTRGRYGVIGYGRGDGEVEAPAVAVEVVDRIGAGDALLSVTSLCAAQQAPLEILAFLGNVAGAEAVATVGNKRTIDKLPFCRHVESLLK